MLFKELIDQSLKSKVILIGGFDRSGTTKLGQIFNKLKNTMFIHEISEISLNLFFLKIEHKKFCQSFFDSYKGKDLSSEIKKIILNYQIKNNISGNRRLEDFWLYLNEKLDKIIIETSPINLELTQQINNNKILMIYTNRNASEIWSSHQRVNWGPSTIFDFARYYELRKILIMASNYKKKTFIIDYEQLGKIESYLKKNYKDSIIINKDIVLPNFTKKQHAKVNENFFHIKKQYRYYDYYLSRLSSHEKKFTRNYFLELISYLYFNLESFITIFKRFFFKPSFFRSIFNNKK